MLLAKFYSGDQVKKNEIGGARGTYGMLGEVHTGFLVGRTAAKKLLGRPKRRWENINLLKPSGFFTYHKV